MSPAPRSSDDPRRIRQGIQELTRPTRAIIVTTGTESFTLPADGSATTTTLNQMLRTLLKMLDDKGIVTVEESP